MALKPLLLETFHSGIMLTNKWGKQKYLVKMACQYPSGGKLGFETIILRQTLPTDTPFSYYMSEERAKRDWLEFVKDKEFTDEEYEGLLV